jgi:hypothetical protein
MAVVTDVWHRVRTIGEQMYAWSRPKGTFFRSILLLVGHLSCTALVFVALFSLGWIVSCVFNYLDTIHKFPDEIFKLVTRLEIGLVYVDAIVSGVVLLAGILRFVRDAVWEGS